MPHTYYRMYSLIIMCILFIGFSCSSEDIGAIQVADQNAEEEIIVNDPPDPNDGDDNDPPPAGDDERFAFDNFLVMEHSYNTGGCTPGPCDTIDTSLNDVFANGQPDDPFFFLAENGVDMNLKCQEQEGRRAEFKQVSEGPLTVASRMEFEGVYFDVPQEGMTIAQVHNRGGNSNKPFFRLELHDDELETVVRMDPEVSSSDTTFDKVSYPFSNGANYNGEPIKILIEKGNGVVHLIAEHNGVILIDDTYAPESNTNWVTDNGIANGYYLKAGIYNPAADHTQDIVMQYTSFVFESDDTN